MDGGPHGHGHGQGHGHGLPGANIGAAAEAILAGMDPMGEWDMAPMQMHHPMHAQHGHGHADILNLEEEEVEHEEDDDGIDIDDEDDEAELLMADHDGDEALIDAMMAELGHGHGHGHGHAAAAAAHGHHLHHQQQVHHAPAHLLHPPPQHHPHHPQSHTTSLTSVAALQALPSPSWFASLRPGDGVDVLDFIGLPQWRHGIILERRTSNRHQPDITGVNGSFLVRWAGWDVKWSDKHIWRVFLAALMD